MSGATLETHWRRMTASDLDEVVRVARLAFPDHFEDRACFAERFALYPEGCFVLAGGGGEVAGYLIAYPWIVGTAPPLNSLVGALPDAADGLYLHDLALHPAMRGLGHTRTVVERLVNQVQGDGWRLIALVAVNQATAFWQKLGFELVHDPGMAEKLASYGDSAAYMVRSI